MRTVLWTEVRNAIIADFPGLDVPHVAPTALGKVMIANADYIYELTITNGDT